MPRKSSLEDLTSRRKWTLIPSEGRNSIKRFWQVATVATTIAIFTDNESRHVHTKPLYHGTSWLEANGNGEINERICIHQGRETDTEHVHQEGYKDTAL